LRASAIYMVGTIVQRGLGILLLPVTTRILGIEQYGLAGTASALAALLATVYGLGLNFTIVRFYYDDPHDARRSDWAALLRLQAGVALVLAALTFATGPLWSRLLGDIGWDSALQIAVIAGVVTSLQGTVMSVMRAQQRPGAFLVIVVIQLVLGSALGILFATSWGAAGYIGGLGIGSLVGLAAGFALTYQRPAWHWSLLASLKVSLPALVHQMSVWGSNLGDRLIIAAYLGASEVARYTIPYTAGTIFLLLLTSAQQAWGPTYLSQGEAARRSLPGRLMVPANIAAGCAVALLVIVGPPLIDILAPESFGVETSLLAIVAIATLPRTAYYMAVVTLVDGKKTGRMATASGLGAVVNVVANLIAIPVFGITAAAVTTVVANVIMAVMCILAAERLLDSSLRLGRLSAVWIGGTVIAVTLSYLPEGWSWAPVRLALGALAIAGLLLAARTLRDTFNSATEGVPLRAVEEAGS
jgi:O-antigen/teichoic acid export membrane protein